MRKGSTILLLVIGVVGLFTYRYLRNVTEKEEKKVVHQQSIGPVETNIKWSDASKDAQTYRIRFDQVVAAVKNGAKCYDVRSFLEYQLGHVSIAEHYSLTTLRKGEFPAVVYEVPIYLYGSDSISSAQAAKLLRDEGFLYVYDLGSVEQIKAIGARLNEWWQ